MNGQEKEIDEHHGVGGTYRVMDGKRVLVEGSRTDMSPRVKIDPVTGERSLMTQEEIAAADSGHGASAVNTKE